MTSPQLAHEPRLDVGTRLKFDRHLRLKHNVLHVYLQTRPSIKHHPTVLFVAWQADGKTWSRGPLADLVPIHSAHSGMEGWLVAAVRKLSQSKRRHKDVFASSIVFQRLQVECA